MLKKKNLGQFPRILELFTQKFVTKLKKYGVGIRDPEKTYSGSRIRVQGSKRHRIPDPEHCKKVSISRAPTSSNLRLSIVLVCRQLSG
jgi:hypothetical protein